MEGGNERYDDVFMGLAQQHGGIQPLLQSFFGFLHRRTDFYVEFPAGSQASMGFPPGRAEKMVRLVYNFYLHQQYLLTNCQVIDTFRSFPMKRYDTSLAQTPAQARAVDAPKQQPAAVPASQQQPPQPKVTRHPLAESKLHSDARAAAPTPTSTRQPTTHDITVRYTDDGKQSM